MTNINKTCYITLYGKAYLSKGIIINDLKTEEIWNKEGFEKSIFKVISGGKFSKKMYRLYEYKN